MQAGSVSDTLKIDRKPMQARSRATLERILSVVDEAVATGEAETISIQEIAKRAKCSTGAFYGRFDGKLAAYAALLERDRESLSEAMASATAEAMRARDVRRWIERLIHLSLDQAITRQSLLRVLDDSGDAIAHRDALVEVTADMLARLGAARQIHAARRADFLLTMISGLCRDAVLSGQIGDDEEATNIFKAELERAAVWYLAAG
tara:strand:+ start:229 stop:846 length:618 start_codon:yes stop_codon:yes gene_type:complete